VTVQRGTLYQTVWRWHFYAGLFVMPMVLVLALSGSLYLFKPQIDRWEERAWQGLPTERLAPPSVQRDAALAAFPGATFHAYRLPERPGDAAMIHLVLAGGTAMRDVFVSPQGKVLGSLDPHRRIIAMDRKLHGQLFLGKRGSWLVELAASWAIVMIVTGLCLWWPRTGGLAGVVWPRLGNRSLFWRDLHAVTGFWVSALALVLLATGLPWAAVWGDGFDRVRAELGWTQDRKEWTSGGEHPASHMVHDHAAMAMGHVHMASSVPLEAIVAQAESEHLAFPVLISPPGTPGAFGGKPDTDWTVRADPQNRPLAVTIRYSSATGREVARRTFADKHPIDRIVGYGIAWHEGALFGWINQLIGLMTALALVTLVVSGFVLWRRRKPAGSLGAPQRAQARLRGKGVRLVIAALFVLLPLFAVSIVTLWLFDRLALPRLPKLARWLGVSPDRALSAN
jgi:uncharacterized iron-regulated membrane protein